MKMKSVLWLAALFSTITAHGQTTAFTYQGKLNDNGASANGIYDLRFTIYDAVTNGNVIGSSLTNAATTVSNGLFTVSLDFGPNVFNGSARWMDIAVRTNGGGVFSTLTPRQAITSTPYAIQSANATAAATALIANSATVAASANSVAATNITGTILNSSLSSSVLTNGASGVNISGSFSGNAGSLTNVQFSSLVVPIVTNPATVIAWGDNTYGETNVPLGLSNVISVAAGSSHSVALRSDGTVTVWGATASWGTNFYGVLDVPSSVTNVVAIATGLGHILALRNDGTVVAWGYNYKQQTNVPTALSNVVAVAGGDQHSLALKSDGTVVAWGGNTVGQTNVPPGLSNVVAVAAGELSSVALTSNGSVVAWGSNAYGQTNVPVGLSNVVAVAAGGSHNLALKNDGTVVAWGWNGYGQTDVPAGLNNVVAVAGGLLHSMALKSDGTLVVWGDVYNSYGVTNPPTDLGTVLAIAPGSRATHVLVIREIHSTNYVFKGDVAATTVNANVLRGDVVATNVDAGVLRGNSAFITNNVNIGITNTGGQQSFSLRVVGDVGSPWKGAGAFGDANASVVLGELNGAATLGGHNASLSSWADLTINPGGGRVAIGTSTFSPNLLTVNGAVGATVFNGSGAGLTSLNPTNLSAGTAGINISGNAATATTAAAVTGNISDTQLSANVSKLNGTNVFSGTNQFNGTAIATNANNQFAGTFTGNGVALTNLNASQLNSGTVNDARLSTNVALLNGTNVFVGTNRFAGTVIATNVNNQLVGTFTGNGATLTNLNASQLTSGTVSLTNLPTTILVTNGQTGVNLTGTFSGNGSGLTNISLTALTVVPLTNNQSGITLTGTFSGNGGSLTNLNASQLLSGTVSDARLSTNVALLSASNSFFTGRMTIGTKAVAQAESQQMQLRVQGTNNSGGWSGGAALGGTNAAVVIGEIQNTAVVGAHSAALDAWANLAINPSGGAKVGIGTTDFSGNNLLTVSGTIGATAFNTTSDRNLKEHLAPVDVQAVLAKVAALPISTWNFKQETNTQHIGPMAQDFYAAFGTGSDDKHIATVDADGVALAAIQALHKKLEAKSSEVEDLKQRLEKMETLLNKLSEQQNKPSKHLR